jgi:hypothetical protein
VRADHAVLLAAAGGVSALTTALSMHMRTASVVVAAAGALRNVAACSYGALRVLLPLRRSRRLIGCGWRGSAELSTLVGQADAVSLLAKALRAQMASPEVVRAVCAALRTLAAPGACRSHSGCVLRPLSCDPLR